MSDPVPDPISKVRPLLKLEAWLASDPVTVGVSGDSMEPTLRDGDAVEVVAAAPDDLQPGDLIVFRAGQGLTVHRLLEKAPGTFLEMGDNRCQGVRYPWPERLGRVTALVRDGAKVDLAGPERMACARATARRSLRRHRAESLAARLPGTLLPRIVRGLAWRLWR